MKHKFDLMVIGGGVLGAFHAYHALCKGLKVALLERSIRPQGATVRNFGQVVPSGMNTKWRQLGRESLATYASIQSQTDLSARCHGSIYLASNPEEMQLIEERNALDKLQEYPSQLWSKEQCQARYPALQAAYCSGGLFYPDELSLNPRVMIHRLLEFMEKSMGLSYFPSTLIQSCEDSSSSCFAYSSSNEVFQASRMLICGGAEVEWLYPEIFQQSDLEFVKLQMLKLEGQGQPNIPGNILTGLSIRRYECFGECPSYKAVRAAEHQDSFAKRWGVHILFKQEADGSIILGDSHEYASVREKDNLDHFLREDVNQYFLDEGAKIMNLAHWRVQDRWAGIYTQCKQNDLLDVQVSPHVRIITGIGGKGMTGSAGLAKKNINEWYG